jgi:hypothetical protein
LRGLLKMAEKSEFKIVSDLIDDASKEISLRYIQNMTEKEILLRSAWRLKKLGFHALSEKVIEIANEEHND